MAGTFIGCFGQEKLWNINLPKTFASLPHDVTGYYEAQRKKFEKKKVTDLLRYWFSVSSGIFLFYKFDN